MGLFQLPAFAEQEIQTKVDAIKTSINVSISLIKDGPDKNQNYRNLVANNVAVAEEHLDTIPQLVTKLILPYKYFEFLEYLGHYKVDYTALSSQAKTLILFSASDIIGLDWTNVEHLYLVGNSDPTGLNLLTRTTLKSIGFFDCGGLTVDQHTAISSLVKDAKTLQNLIVMNWGNTEIEESAFCGTGTGTASGSLVQVIIHKATVIRDKAFYYCCNLSSVSIPDATIIGTSIGDLQNGPFHYCTYLRLASFPAATDIGSYAFFTCTYLQSASFPVVTNIGKAAFNECRVLNTISFPVAINVYDGAFYHCYALQSASFPFATNILSSAFRECRALQSAFAPVCTVFGEAAFYNCINLQTISFPSNARIGGNVFSGCSMLKITYLPEV
ncbi:MAG: leucine-rich repeat domain-containing protein [Holosporales bacterium]|nr:leucine-rich repeat domain-containing protein [Holosporales bacterium]